MGCHLLAAFGSVWWMAHSSRIQIHSSQVLTMKLNINSEILKVKLGVLSPGDGFFHEDNYYLVVGKTAHNGVAAINLQDLSYGKLNSYKHMDTAIDVIPCEVSVNIKSPIEE